MPVTYPTIETADDIRAGVRHLRRRCPAMRAMHDRSGDPPLRRYPADFAGLARIIVGQQLSSASASAIWQRLETKLGRVTAKRWLATDTDALRAAGLSSAKLKTLEGLARAVAERRLDVTQLASANDEAVVDTLTQLSGIGPWTAHIFILFCLGRRDAFAVGDLALQVGAAKAFGHGERLNQAELTEIAERWRPWRGVAARLIWSDYANLRAAGAPLAPAGGSGATGSSRR
ncbi:MAG: DNA-3-methyladenine glycosylase [Hyphomicrobiaceae bacterium]